MKLDKKVDDLRFLATQSIGAALVSMAMKPKHAIYKLKQAVKYLEQTVRIIEGPEPKSLFDD